MPPYGEVPALLLAAAIIETIGGITGVLLFDKLCRASRLVGERSLCITGLAFLAYSAGLVLEALGNIYTYSAGVEAPSWSRRPETVSLLALNRGTLLAAPLYIVAYTLCAVALYYTHVPLEDGRRNRIYAAAPLVLQMYVDYNLVALVVLSAAVLLATRRYGGVKGPGIVFYLLAAASHATAVALALIFNPILIPVSMILRAAALLGFAASTMLAGK